MTHPSSSAVGGAATRARVPVTVVIPVRNALDLIGECLSSIVAARPGEVIVVDGGSTDGTVELVESIAADAEVPVQVIDDGGAGVSGARTMGVQRARFDVVALIDADVVLPSTQMLADWFEEYDTGGWVGLQAGLAPESADGDYWSEALALHQATGRSRHWFTLCATLMDRDVLLEHGFDDSFSSGEDIELRHRFQRARLPVGVSRRAHVRHRFVGGWDAAKHQWDDDGAGLARTIVKNGIRDVPLLGIPLAGFVRGLLVTVWRRPSIIGYWCCYLVFNYVSMGRALLSGLTRSGGQDAGGGVTLATARVLPMVLGFLTWLLVARWFPASEVGYAALGLTIATLTTHLAAGGPGHSVIVRLPGAGHPVRLILGSLLLTLLVATVTSAGLSGGLLMAHVLPRSVVPWTIAASVSLSLAYCLDHVAIAQQRTGSVLVRTIVQSACLLALLVGLDAADLGPGSHVVLAATVGGAVVSCLGGLGVLARGAIPGAGTKERFGGALAQLAVSLAHRAPMLALPTVMALIGSPADAGVWYVVWMMWLAVWFVPNSVATAAQAQLVRSGREDWARILRRTEQMSLRIGVVAAVGMAVVGPALLALMGESYLEAWPALLVLLVAVGPASISEPALAALRASGRIRFAVLSWLFAGAGALLAIWAIGGSLVVSAAVWLVGQALLMAWLLRRTAYLDRQGGGARRKKAADRRQPTRSRLALIVTLLVTGLGSASIGTVSASPSDVSHLGLISALGPWWWAGLACVVVLIVLALRMPGVGPRWPAALGWLGLVLLLYGTPILMTGAPRLEASYRHLGIIEQIQETGHADRTIDAYFNWPGFFAEWSLLRNVTGAPEGAMLGLATAAPLVAMLLYLPAQLLILRHLTDDWRLKWLALVLFAALNWPGQDYFAPQTLAMLGYLSIVALVLQFAKPSGEPRPGPRRVALAVVLVSMAMITCSHQLTPFMLVVTLGMLLVVRRLGSWWWLGFAAAGLAAFWLAVPAWPYLSGHLEALVEDVGDAEAAAQSNFLDRLVAGTPAHRIVVVVRLGLAALIWTVGGIGVLVLRHQGRRWGLPAVLLGAPFFLLPLQAYGGELLIRVYYFSLLGAAFGLAVVAGSLLRSGRWAPLRTAVLLGLVGIVAASAILTRYGNEAGEGFTRQEVGAFAWVYEQPAEQLSVVALTHNTPWRFSRYASASHVAIEQAEPGPPWAEPLTLARVLAALRQEEALDGERQIFIVWTRTQSTMAELSGNTDPGQVDRVLDQVGRDPRARVLVATDQVRVLAWLGS